MMSKEKIHCYKNVPCGEENTMKFFSPMHDPNGVMTNNVCALKVCTLTSEYKTRKPCGSSPDS
jgi:hypothetical protein